MRPGSLSWAALLYAAPHLHLMLSPLGAGAVKADANGGGAPFVGAAFECRPNFIFNEVGSRETYEPSPDAARGCRYDRCQSGIRGMETAELRQV